MRPLLAIDTSGAIAGVAIYDGRVLAETIWRSGRQHSRTVLRTIDQALELAGVERSALTAIGLASGPGSYSGLRVGASTAIGLSLALSIPVVHVPTLEVLAYGVRADEMSLRPAVEVGRGRYASARFARIADAVHQRSDIVSVDFDGLVGLAAHESALLIGDFSADELERKGDAGIISGAAGLRRAGFLAELAAERLNRGDLTDAGAAQLIYLNP